MKSACKRKRENSKSLRKAAESRFQCGAYSVLFVCAVRTRPFKIYIPGAQVHAHAAVHTCNSNYDDKHFPGSHTEICQNHDVHCSVQAFRLIMEWLP